MGMYAYFIYFYYWYEIVNQRMVYPGHLPFHLWTNTYLYVYKEPPVGALLGHRNFYGVRFPLPAVFPVLFFISTSVVVVSLVLRKSEIGQILFCGYFFLVAASMVGMFIRYQLDKHILL